MSLIKRLALGLWLTACVNALAEDAITTDDVQPVLKQLGATLTIRQRPAWPKPSATPVVVTLSPQVDQGGDIVVSFGVPFGPDVLADEKMIRVVADGAEEIAAYVRPLAHWWIDGK